MIIVDDLFSTCEVKPIYSHSDHSASPLSLCLSLSLSLSISPLLSYLRTWQTA